MKRKDELSYHDREEWEHWNTWEEESGAEVDDRLGSGEVGEVTENLGGGTEGLDTVADDNEGAVAEDAGGGVHGDEEGVVEN